MTIITDPSSLDPRLGPKPTRTSPSEWLTRLGCFILAVCLLAIAVSGTVAFVRWAL